MKTVTLGTTNYDLFCTDQLLRKVGNKSVSNIKLHAGNGLNLCFAVKFNEGVNEFCTTRSCLASVYHVVGLF